MALLLGGDSPERAVSLNSAAAVARALAEQGAEMVSIDTQDSGWWNRVEGFDVAFIIVHGSGGEDGVLQGTLEAMGVPYTGTGVAGSALALDKIRSKQLWRAMGLPTADCAILTADSDWAGLIDQMGPLFVKPATGGSSIASGQALTAAELESRWQQARGHGVVMAEQLIEGDEYTVGILGDRALPAIRLETDNAFYDYQAKYESDDTRYVCPCGLEAQVENALGEMALAAFSGLGCEVWGRVDFIRDRDGQFLLLEANTVPGMTDHSLVPMAAAAVGIDFNELVSRVVRLSLEEC